MKKSLIFLTVILVVVLSVALIGCGGGLPPQSMLVPPWNDYKEILTFDVMNEDNEVLGTFTVSFEKHDDKNKSYNIADENLIHKDITPEYEASNFYGYVVKSDLVLNDGSYKQSLAITTMQFAPVYSYSISDFKDKNPNDDEVKGEKLELEYKYNEKSISYRADSDTNGEVDKSGSIKSKKFEQAAYFDNALYIALNRTMPFVQAQMSFTTPSYTNETMMKRTVSNTTEVAEIKPYGDIAADKFNHAEAKEDKSMVTCHKSNISSAEEMPGSGKPIIYYYSTVPYYVTEGIRVDNLLVQFEEHDLTYKLKDVRMVYVG